MCDACVQLRIELLVCHINTKEYKKVLKHLNILLDQGHQSDLFRQAKEILYTNVLNDFKVSLATKAHHELKILCHICDVYDKRTVFTQVLIDHIFLNYHKEPCLTRTEWCQRQTESIECYVPSEWHIKDCILSHFLPRFRSDLLAGTLPVRPLMELAAKITFFEQWAGKPDLRADLLSNQAQHYVESHPPTATWEPVEFFKHVWDVADTVVAVVGTVNLLRVPVVTYLHDYAKRVFTMAELEVILKYIPDLGTKLNIPLNATPFQTQLDGYVQTTVDKLMLQVYKLLTTAAKMKYAKQVLEPSEYIVGLTTMVDTLQLPVSEALRLVIMNALLKTTLREWRKTILELKIPVNPEQIFHDFSYLESSLLAKYSKKVFEDEILQCKTLLTVLVASIYPNGDFVETCKAHGTDVRLFQTVLRLKAVPKKDQEMLLAMFHGRHRSTLNDKKNTLK